MEKQPFDELLKTYKVKLKILLSDLNECESGTHNQNRIRTQIACYREFITELKEAMQ